jgi:hypothetical protein
MTDEGPISAENELAKILVAGFGVGPSKDNDKQAVLAWGFDFEMKQPLKLEAVKVEEVSPSTSPLLLIEDISPVLKDSIWSGNVTPAPANRSATPWLYSSEKSVYIFRFIIKPTGEPAFVLYQATWFSGPAKQLFQKVIAKVETG